MQTDKILTIIKPFILQVLSDRPDLFCVRTKIKPTQNIKVYLDGDMGVTIEDCTKINRALYKLIEETALFPSGDFSLEVSSPGVDEPLVNLRQYQKNIGRKVMVVFTDDSQKEGILQEVAVSDIILETVIGKGKKAVTEKLVIPFSKIKATTVQVIF
jgi:ribosome maturation factor RimP